MGMEVSCAVLDGVTHAHMSLEPLVQIASLSDIDRNPSSILGLFGVDVIARQRLERSVQGKNFVWILLAGLARPPDQTRGCLLRVPVTTE